ncbi:MAG TPA: glucose-6-phosphate isomerase family protein [Jatrophihabitantaceae bacterium]|nr:glucose-6-phosphate isomerase family protein [Jatrophihabitantaceae bacterium]
MTFATPPVAPMRVVFDLAHGAVEPAGPVLTRRMSDLDGLFARDDLRRAMADGDDPVVYTVTSSPVPEIARELPQSVTTIKPGTVDGEFFMTKGHQHPDAQGEVYLGLSGVGGVLMHDCVHTEWVEIQRGVIAYIPPGWAHRSVNIGDHEYSFLAVYPGSAGHDYSWVVEHGMGERVYASAGSYTRVPFTRSAMLRS